VSLAAEQLRPLETLFGLLLELESDSDHVRLRISLLIGLVIEATTAFRLL